MSGGRSNGWTGVAALRETATQTAARIKAAGRALYVVVDENLEKVELRQLRVREPHPVDAPGVTLPVNETAAERGIKSSGEAVEKAIGQDVEEQRTDLKVKRAKARSAFWTARSRRSQAEVVVAEAEKERDAFMERVPANRRWRLGKKAGLPMRLVPWALWAADTTIMARPWGIFGGVPIPFAHSHDLSSATLLVRAMLVSFGLIFGLRLIGNRLRDIADRARLASERSGHAVDLLVIALVAFFAFRLAEGTAQMQAAMVAVVTGGTSVSVPTSALLSIVAFLMAVSLACGYFLNESEIEQAQANDKRVMDARSALAEAVGMENDQRGEVRSLREQLRGLDRMEALLVAEQQAHTNQEVEQLKENNQHLYGIDVAASAGKNNGTKGTTGNTPGKSDGTKGKSSDAPGSNGGTPVTPPGTPRKNRHRNGRANGRGRG